MIAMEASGGPSKRAIHLSKKPLNIGTRPTRLEAEKHFELAVTEYKRVVGLEPAFAGGFVSLGQACMEAHDFASALAPLKHALQLDPNLLFQHINCWAMRYSRRDTLPKRFHTWNARTRMAHLASRRLKPASLSTRSRIWKPPSRKRPNDPDLLYYLGRASGLLSKQSVDTLLAVLSKICSRVPIHGGKLFVLRQMDEAQKQYEQALQVRPDTPNLAPRTRTRSSL